jgi:hypothetical protein
MPKSIDCSALGEGRFEFNALVPAIVISVSIV